MKKILLLLLLAVSLPVFYSAEVLAHSCDCESCECSGDCQDDCECKDCDCGA